MAQIAYCRRFNGTSDEIELDPADYSGVTPTATTIAAIVKRGTTNNSWGWIWSVEGPGTGQGEWVLGNGDVGDPASSLATFMTPGGTGGVQTAADYLTNALGWCLVAVTKADGLVQPRFHRYRYDTQAWDHTSHASNCSIGAAFDASNTKVWVGTYDGAQEWFDGDIACIAAWPQTALTDGQLESMVDAIAAWEALSPTGLWLLNQDSVVTPVRDRVGNGDQTAINGTTAVSISDLPFDVGGETSFPTTPILDTFAGGNENPITTNWTCPAKTGDQNLRIVSNTLRNEFQGAEGSGYYDLSTFGPDCEVYATLTTKPLGADQVRLYLRLKDVGTAGLDGYEVRLTNAAGTDLVEIFRVDNGSDTRLHDPAFELEFSDGDGFGASMIGDTITAYRRSGGTWAAIAIPDVSTDTTYPDAGYLGVKMSQSETTSPALDDFGGGTVVVSGRTYKRLYGPAQLTGTAATLYTCPTGKRARVLNIHASNPSGSPVDLNLSIGTDAAATRIFDDFPLAADSVKEDFTQYQLEAGHKIQGWASSAATVNLTISGFEEPA